LFQAKRFRIPANAHVLDGLDGEGAESGIGYALRLASEAEVRQRQPRIADGVYAHLRARNEEGKEGRREGRVISGKKVRNTGHGRQAPRALLGAVGAVGKV